MDTTVHYIKGVFSKHLVISTDGIKCQGIITHIEVSLDFQALIDFLNTLTLYPLHYYKSFHYCVLPVQKPRFTRNSLLVDMY